MSNLLRKPWAKVMAFLLLLVFAAGTLLCAVILWDMYLGGSELKAHPLFYYRNWVKAGMVACPVACLLLLAFSLASAGRWEDHEGIHLTWLDQIPLEIDLAVLLLTLNALRYHHYYGSWISELFFLLLTAALTLLLLLVFTAQCKAGPPWKYTLLYRLLRFSRRLLRKLLRGLFLLLKNLPLLWKCLLGMVSVAALLLCTTLLPVEGRIATILMLILPLTGVLLYLTLDLHRLLQAGEKLAQGDYSHQPKLFRHTLPEFRRHAYHLGSVQEGVQRAVAERMKSEHLKTELITNVSHDIKTPLTSIINYVDLLQKTDPNAPETREYLQVLQRQSQRLKKLTEDLVEAAKASSGNIPVHPEPTDLSVLLHQVCGEYTQRLEEAHIEPILQAAPQLPYAMADGRLLWRVLDNLMGNVCKYALPGTRVYLTASQESGALLLEIKNISQHPLTVAPEELTERFVRGDSSRSTEGSGLGLSIAAGLISLQRGTFQILLDGDLFKVRITLPQAEPEN